VTLIVTVLIPVVDGTADNHDLLRRKAVGMDSYVAENSK